MTTRILDVGYAHSPARDKRVYIRIVLFKRGGLTSSRSRSISEIKLGPEFTGATQRFLPRRRLKSLAAPPLRQRQRRRPSDRGWTLLQWRYRGCLACVDRDRTSARIYIYTEFVE